MEARPWLASEENKQKDTPVRWAVLLNKIDVLRVLLECDWSLGYQISTAGLPLIGTAATRGHVDVARELLKHCPDAPCCDEDGTCLHRAVWNNQSEFVEFILGSQKLRKLVNARDMNGRTALHCAVHMCNPRTVAALLMHKDIDVTVLNNGGAPPIWTLPDDQAKTLNWVRMYVYFPNTPVKLTVY